MPPLCCGGEGFSNGSNAPIAIWYGRDDKRRANPCIARFQVGRNAVDICAKAKLGHADALLSGKVRERRARRAYRPLARQEIFTA